MAPLAATAAVTGRQATSAATALTVAVAVEGSNGALWVQAPQLGSGWHSLGGKIIGPPAVIAEPSTSSTPLEPLFIAVGTNNALWARTLTVGWHPLGGTTCYAVGAVVASGNLSVACLGLYNNLWTYNTTDITGCSGLPCLTNPPTDLGGTLTAAPAVTPFGDYIVLGTGSEIYISSGGEGFTGTPWRCIGYPGASGYTTAEGGTTIFGCAGTNRALWTASEVLGTWTSAVSLGGVLISGPAIAATSSVTEFFVVGTNHAVWQRTLTSGWTSLGGYAVGGVAAVDLG